MELTVKENSIIAKQETAISKVPANYRPYVIARISKPPIKSLDDYNLERGIKNIVIIAFAEMGIKDAGDDKVVTFLCETLLRDLRAARFQHITLEEIRLFISNGIRGEYPTFNGQMNTINIQNIHFWIKCGIASKDREAAMSEYNKQMDAQLTSSKPVYFTPKYFRDASIDCFEKYKVNGELPFFPHVIHDYIAKNIGIEYEQEGESFQGLPIEQKKRDEVYVLAKEDYKRDLHKKDRLATAKLLDQMFANHRRAFEFKLKRFYLMAYFDQLKAENLPLELPEETDSDGIQ